jgi:multicomponent Na+:H+ antiporter subunit F
MTAVTTITLGLLAAAIGISLGAALRGPTSTDRMLAVDLLLVALSGGLAAAAAFTGRVALLPVVLSVSLVAFVGTVVVGRTLERERRR